MHPPFWRTIGVLHGSMQNPITLLAGFVMLLASFPAVGQGVPAGAQAADTPPPDQPASVITFSPAPGQYNGPVTVAIRCPRGLRCFFTLDGSPPNIASTEYTRPIPVTATETLSVIAARIGQAFQDTGASSRGWKCLNPRGGASNGLACGGGAGVGSQQPSAWDWHFGEPMTEMLSTTASSSETQQLYIFGGPGCYDCMLLAQDKFIQPSAGARFIANNEMDAYLYDPVDQKEMMCGLQCNQQNRWLQWQVDSGAGTGWQDTGIRTGCPLSTTSPTHVSLTCHRVPGDTGCGGRGCVYYDDLCVNGACSALNIAQPLKNNPGRYKAMGNQDQIDLTNTRTSGVNPTTAIRSVWNNNVSAGYYGTTTTASGTWVIR
ncbi:MAG: chitobiase/beta-hexosaminidase C-terminal domain-containing protein [Acidobacteriaceae bacterium]